MAVAFSCATTWGEPVLFSGAITNLERKGKVDAITGLFMHGKCLQVLDRLLACERPSGGVLLLGLDDFSRVNSLNDHAFGNGVLRSLRTIAPAALT